MNTYNPYLRVTFLVVIQNIKGIKLKLIQYFKSTIVITTIYYCCCIIV